MGALDSLNVKHAVINATASGANVVVAGVEGKRIRVIAYSFLCTAAVVATWKSDTTAISGPMAFATNGGISAPEVASGHMQALSGEDLVLSLGGAVVVGGHVAYAEVTAETNEE